MDYWIPIISVLVVLSICAAAWYCADPPDAPDDPWMREFQDYELRHHYTHGAAHDQAQQEAAERKRVQRDCDLGQIRLRHTQQPFTADETPRQVLRDVKTPLLGWRKDG